MQMWPVGFSNKVLVFIYIKNSFIFNFVWIMDSIMDRSLVWPWRTTQNHGLMKNWERRPRRCEWELILIFFRIWLVSQIRPQSSETTRGAHTNQLVTRWTLGSITNPAEKERKRNKQESAKNLNHSSNRNGPVCISNLSGTTRVSLGEKVETLSNDVQTS
jgi:hypothetical protein